MLNFQGDLNPHILLESNTSSSFFPIISQLFNGILLSLVKMALALDVSAFCLLYLCGHDQYPY